MRWRLKVNQKGQEKAATHLLFDLRCSPADIDKLKETMLYYLYIDTFTDAR